MRQTGVSDPIRVEFTADRYENSKALLPTVPVEDRMDEQHAGNAGLAGQSAFNLRRARKCVLLKGLVFRHSTD